MKAVCWCFVIAESPSNVFVAVGIIVINAINVADVADVVEVVDDAVVAQNEVSSASAIPLRRHRRKCSSSSRRIFRRSTKLIEFNNNKNVDKYWSKVCCKI